MTTPEAEFTRELEVFRTEVEAAKQFFYAWLTVHSVINSDSHVYDVLNGAPVFWNTSLGALQTASFIALGRIFDEDARTHSVYRLLRTARDNPSIFSKEALAERKRKDATDADRWLADYLRHVYVPTAEDFRKLHHHIKARKKIYQSNYDPLRNQVFAHKQVLDHAGVEALFAKTKIREMQRLLVFLSRLHDALWELLNNGRKPNLRPERYSVRRMRQQPSPMFGHHTVQEQLIRETERFLKSLVREGQ